MYPVLVNVRGREFNALLSEKSKRLDRPTNNVVREMESIIGYKIVTRKQADQIVEKHLNHVRINWNWRIHKQIPLAFRLWNWRYYLLRDIYHWIIRNQKLDEKETWKCIKEARQTLWFLKRIKNPQTLQKLIERKESAFQMAMKEQLRKRLPSKKEIEHYEKMLKIFQKASSSPEMAFELVKILRM